MKNCIFCRIIANELPANIVYQDELVIAFDDAYPRAPQHKLIVPRQHIATVNDLTIAEQQLAGHLILTAQKIAIQLDIAELGYRLVMNCNSYGGQVVYHLHLHLLGGHALPFNC